MVSLKVGTVISGADIKRGTGQKGAWAMAKIKAEKGYDDITLWVDNLEYVDFGAQALEVTAINRVVYAKRKWEKKDGTVEWQPQVSANVDLKVSSKAVDVPKPIEQIEGFAMLNDKDIPF